MSAIAQRPSADAAVDRMLDWAAHRRTRVSAAVALVVGLSVWGALQPVHAAGCAAPVIASAQAISPAVLV